MAFTFDPDTAARLVGVTGQARLQVANFDTAIAVGSGDLPVLATPRMIALMEQAACAALTGWVPPTDTSVGTRIDVRHAAPTGIGGRVTATAVVTRAEPSRVTFEVTALDDSTGAVIGRGEHFRVLVERDGFLSRL